VAQHGAYLAGLFCAALSASFGTKAMEQDWKRFIAQDKFSHAQKKSYLYEDWKSRARQAE